jgi:hypothetical protein
VLCATVVNPEANERSNGVEHLPEGHDFSTNLWWRQLTNIDRTGGFTNILD